MSKKVLVSGIQASGKLHIGNYFGAMKQNIELGNSDEYESYIFIADYHALTTVKNAEELRKNTFDLACAYIAMGLDHRKAYLFKQSDVLEHTELSWILSTVTPMSTLNLAHAFKDKQKTFSLYCDGAKIASGNFNDSEQLEFNLGLSYFTLLKGNHTISVKNYLNEIVISDVLNIEEAQRKLAHVAFDNTFNNAGLFTYPVLMASDILMYQANIVPVGKDQAQHVEMTREIAGKFNRAYSTDFFTMPQAYIKKEVEIVPGIDGEKMSKSKGNVIPLFGTDEEIKKAVMGIVTDSARPEDKKNPDENNIYKIHKLFLSEEEDTSLRARYEGGGLSYKEAKDLLLTSVIDFILPKRAKYEYYQTHPEDLQEILAEGGKKAREKAIATMSEVRKIVGLI